MAASSELRSSRPALDVLGVAAWTAVAAALLLVLFVAREADVTMGGQLQRIFYIHVPSAWLGYLSFAIVFLASIAYLRTGAERWDLLAHASAEIGIVFTSLVLVTGPIWARPVWGTWWEWDARLTSTLVLWLTYAGYLFLRSLASDQQAVGRLAAVVGIVGFLDVPIVHFSVQWWRTLHPSGPAVTNPTTGSGRGREQMSDLAWLAVAFSAVWLGIGAYVFTLARRQSKLERRLEQLADD